jgi:hypothetical protein
VQDPRATKGWNGVGEMLCDLRFTGSLTTPASQPHSIGGGTAKHFPSLYGRSHATPSHLEVPAARAAAALV